MFKFVDGIFEYLGLLLLFINVIIFIKSRANKSKAFNIFSLNMLFILIILLASLILNVNGINNLYLSHFYFGFQFIFLSLFYKSLFASRFQKKIVNVTLFLVTSVLCVQYSVQPDLFFKFNILEILICSFPLVIYAILHLYNSLTKKGEFIYINIGVLIYLSTSTLIFLLGDYLAGIKSTVVKTIWLLNKILYVVYLLLIYFEWYKHYRKRKAI